MVETLKSQAAITKTLEQIEIKEAHAKALYTLMLEMKKEWIETKYEIKMLTLKLPMEIARQRQIQKVLASKRAWWARMQAEKRATNEAALEKKKKPAAKKKAARH